MTESPQDLRDEPFEPEVLHSDLVYRGRVWDVRSDRVRYGDGEIVRQYVDHTGAVAIVALDDEGRVLLIQQYRHPIRHRDWELPAGLLDVEGEEPLAAARRELAEEADLVAERWEPLVSSWTTPGGNDEIIHVFLATGVSSADAAHDREDEEADIRVAWVPLSDAVSAVLEGRMRNGILAIGVLAASQRLRDRD
ncbi:NUDIX hydrolase [Microbacterium oxydans]|jgi:ADP-ribose pyrophosphatase|uniref:Methanol dehydrogenase activator n=1 Tax=Microbacterium oxydans TaxID=82380 RepID=A0A3Q9J623_9MICO|nr:MULTISPECIES: NUDIX hydrolase [Microbacterium]AZS40065.1 Methanol dehydrogenase activator [Microbacterium oxydans]KAB1891609.1 NUDIX hydrolase [Microbacterium oxydans]KKX96913.1 ADP-ribose pyrophosphatase [Microbacterium sp. Ag1]MBE7954999.1 NUDIX hydrolase [Microbacterium sp. R1]MCB8044261.1 NUDIX hydrolase [Microbacterium oxydans]